MSKNIMADIEPFLESEGLIFYKSMRMENFNSTYPKAVAIYNLIMKHLPFDEESKEMTNMDLEYLEKIEAANTRPEVELAFIEFLYSMKEITTRAILKLYASKGLEVDESAVRDQVYGNIESGYQTCVDKAVEEYFAQ